MSDKAIGWTAVICFLVGLTIAVVYAWVAAICGPFREPIDIAAGITAGAFGFVGFAFGIAWVD